MAFRPTPAEALRQHHADLYRERRRANILAVVFLTAIGLAAWWLA